MDADGRDLDLCVFGDKTGTVIISVSFNPLGCISEWTHYPLMNLPPDPSGTARVTFVNIGGKRRRDSFLGERGQSSTVSLTNAYRIVKCHSQTSFQERQIPKSGGINERIRIGSILLIHLIPYPLIHLRMCKNAPEKIGHCSRGGIRTSNDGCDSIGAYPRWIRFDGFVPLFVGLEIRSGFGFRTDLLHTK